MKLGRAFQHGLSFDRLCTWQYFLGMSHRPFDKHQQEQFQAMIEGLSQHGMTNTEIARKVGCSRQQIWRIESGYSRRPSYELGSRLRALHDKTVAK